MANSDETAIRQRIADERTERVRSRYKEVMLSEAPPPVSPFTDKGVVDSVFAELWSRSGLTTKERRLVTLACVGAAGAEIPTQRHVRAALESRDISVDEMKEFVLHFAYYHGWPRASAIEQSMYEAIAALEQEGKPVA